MLDRGNGSAPVKKREASGSQIPAGDARFSTNVRVDLHARWKVHAARVGKSMSLMLEEWIEKHVPPLPVDATAPAIADDV